MTIEMLEAKVKRLEKELDIAKEKLYKKSPKKPLVHDETQYDSNIKGLVHKYTYFCSYCGESIRKKQISQS